MVVQRAALVSEEDLACMSRKNFNVVGTQRRVRGVVVVDLGAAMAAVVLVVRVLGGHREKGSEDERDRRRSNGQGEPAHVCARGPACARGSLYAHASRGSWLA
jgi:hypothetical protein